MAEETKRLNVILHRGYVIKNLGLRSWRVRNMRTLAGRTYTSAIDAKRYVDDLSADPDSPAQTVYDPERMLRAIGSAVRGDVEAVGAWRALGAIHGYACSIEDSPRVIGGNVVVERMD